MATNRKSSPDDEREDTGPGAQQRVVRTAIWTPGTKLPALPESSVFAMGRAAKPPSRRGGARVHLPALDPATLVFSTSRPKPVNPFFTHRGGSKYAAVFAGLTAPGMSVEVPIAYHGTLKSLAKKLAAKGKGRFTVFKVNDTTCGVWREEDAE